MNPDPSQNYEIDLIQGATKVLVITWYDVFGSLVDLTGYSANILWRTTVEDTGSPIIEISTTNGHILLGGTAGTITCTVPSTTTSALTNGQTMVYNLFLTDTFNIVTPLLAGPTYVFGSTIR